MPTAGYSTCTYMQKKNTHLFINLTVMLPNKDTQNNNKHVQTHTHFNVYPWMAPTLWGAKKGLYEVNHLMSKIELYAYYFTVHC